MPDVIVGIDLGTTNSEVAIVQEGRPRVLPGDDGDPILPSFVGLSDDGRLLVGKLENGATLIRADRDLRGCCPRRCDGDRRRE